MFTIKVSIEGVTDAEAKAYIIESLIKAVEEVGGVLVAEARDVEIEIEEGA